uniref:Uncharacterized protein n=1 Tax=Chrysotila carterae TaxID=13221 RepID=A0A6T0CBA0_CHRCT
MNIGEAVGIEREVLLITVTIHCSNVHRNDHFFKLERHKNFKQKIIYGRMFSEVGELRDRSFGKEWHVHLAIGECGQELFLPKSSKWQMNVVDEHLVPGKVTQEKVEDPLDLSAVCSHSVAQEELYRPLEAPEDAESESEQCTKEEDT